MNKVIEKGEKIKTFGFMFTYIVSKLGLMFLGGRLGAAWVCRDG